MLFPVNWKSSLEIVEQVFDSLKSLQIEKGKIQLEPVLGFLEGYYESERLKRYDITSDYRGDTELYQLEDLILRMRYTLLSLKFLELKIKNLRKVEKEVDNIKSMMTSLVNSMPVEMTGGKVY